MTHCQLHSRQRYLDTCPAGQKGQSSLDKLWIVIVRSTFKFPNCQQLLHRETSNYVCIYLCMTAILWNLSVQCSHLLLVMCNSVLGPVGEESLQNKKGLLKCNASTSAKNKFKARSETNLHQSLLLLDLNSPKTRPRGRKRELPTSHVFMV